MEKKGYNARQHGATCVRGSVYFPFDLALLPAARVMFSTRISDPVPFFYRPDDSIHGTTPVST